MLRLLKAIKSHKFGIIYLKICNSSIQEQLKVYLCTVWQKMFAKQIKGNYLANTLSF